MKTPFTLDAWLKDKSQKIETRNGRPVHYIGLDRAGWQVFEIFRTNGTSEYRTYHDSYMYCGPEESTYDLFIVTPEPEFTEFEKKLWEVMKSEGSPIGPIEKFTDDDKRVFHAYSARLLSLARDQFIKDGYVIEKKAFHDAVEKVAPEVMNEVSENIGQLTEFEERIFKLLRQYKECDIPLTPENIKAEASMLWPDFEKYFFDLYGREGEGDSALRSFYYRGLADGKAESLKDLPRWKKGNIPEGEIALRQVGIINIAYGVKRGGIDDSTPQTQRYILISELEKLPGFNED